MLEMWYDGTHVYINMHRYARIRKHTHAEKEGGKERENDLQVHIYFNINAQRINTLHCKGKGVGKHCIYHLRIKIACGGIGM